MKTDILYKVSLLSLLSLAACGGIVSYATLHKKVHQIEGTISAQYSSIKDLVDDSTLIVKVRAFDQTSEEYQGVVFTNTDVHVQKVLKGDISSNTNIKVLETGGTKGGEEYNFEGVSPMKGEHDYFLFLQKYQGGIPGAQYVIVGAYQGRLDINSNSVSPANPNSNHFNVSTLTKLISDVQSDVAH